MSLIKSISGIRGTIGGEIGKNLTPVDIVKFTTAYGFWVKLRALKEYKVIIIGRDARISGEIIANIVIATLQFLGIHVVYLDLSTTPTVAMMVSHLKANGGIILTASHNPKNWNALKFLNENGELISTNEGNEILSIMKSNAVEFCLIHEIGKCIKNIDSISIHINKILNLSLVKQELIKKKKFKIVVDCVNSSGSISVLPLLKKLNCEVIELYTEPNGDFPHNPEPLFEHLGEIIKRVPKENADLGIVVDPDVDRLVFINEDGTFFGEEYTLIAIADYVLQNEKGPVVSNLSSSRILKNITDKYSQKYFISAVGEFNVVQKMKEVSAIIGGEGNGGIIYPELHYGRDAMVGIALFLSYLAVAEKSCKEIRESYPSLFMSKKKIKLNSSLHLDHLFDRMREKYKFEKCTTIDGLKIDFSRYWIHLRKSNTEPIIRVYTEASTQKKANDLAESFIKEILSII